MGNYSDPSSTFKLIHGAEKIRSSKRNMAIFDMLLNGLGIPDKFHEFIRALFVSGNWDDHEGMEEITLYRMARNVSSLSDQVFLTVYNRLKKNGPAFLKWQEEKEIELIQYERIRTPFTYKTRIKYGFPYYSTVAYLFSLDKSVPQKEIRKMVKDICKSMPKVEKEKRQKRKRSPESIADSVVRVLEELRESTTSDVEFIAELEMALERKALPWRFSPR